MDTKSAYNSWAKTYDTQQNSTRDLDEKLIANSLQLFDNKIIVEGGCGTGKNTAQILPIARSIFCMDFSIEMLSSAKRKFSSPKVNFLLNDMTNPWPYTHNFADVVTINLVLEHIENIDFVFQQASNILKPTGLLFVNELHPDKQVGGSVAHFELNGKDVRLASFYHSILDFKNAGEKAGFKRIMLDNIFDPTDKNKPPRILSIQMTK